MGRFSTIQEKGERSAHTDCLHKNELTSSKKQKQNKIGQIYYSQFLKYFVHNFEMRW